MTKKEFIDLLTNKFMGYIIEPINELNTINIYINRLQVEFYTYSKTDSCEWHVGFWIDGIHRNFPLGKDNLEVKINILIDLILIELAKVNEKLETINSNLLKLINNNTKLLREYKLKNIN